MEIMLPYTSNLLVLILMLGYLTWSAVAERLKQCSLPVSFDMTYKCPEYFDDQQ